MRDKLAVLVLAFAALLGLSATGTRAAASPTTNPACPSGFGIKLPVLMVHGLNSDRTIWLNGSSSVSKALDAVKDIVVDTFDYKGFATEWVTNKAIGPKLAERIDCLAQNSLAGKGLGKVIVLAHSMGGLAAQYAMAQIVNGHKVADEADFLISIATPYLGSGFANLCLELEKLRLHAAQCQGSAIKALAAGSKELSDLPPFPSSVAIKALSGNVTIDTQVLTQQVKVPMFGDLVVSTASAERYSTEKGKGDGKRRFDCEGRIAIPALSDAPCEHNKLLTNADVQAEVVRSIQAYLAFVQVPVKTFYGLQLRLGPEWEVIKNDPLKDTRTVIVRGKECDNPYRLYCPGFVIVNLRAAEPKLPYSKAAEIEDDCYNNWIYDDVGYGTPQEVGSASIGGLPAKRYQQSLCAELGGHPDMMYSWRVEGRVVIYDLDLYDSTPVKGLDGLLASATWKIG